MPPTFANERGRWQLMASNHWTRSMWPALSREQLSHFLTVDDGIFEKT